MGTVDLRNWAKVEDPAPLLSVRGLSRHYGARIGCGDVTFDLFPGEVLAIWPRTKAT